MTLEQELEQELEEIYEIVVGDSGRLRYTRKEFLEYLQQILNEKENNLWH